MAHKGEYAFCSASKSSCGNCAMYSYMGNVIDSYVCACRSRLQIYKLICTTWFLVSNPSRLVCMVLQWPHLPIVCYGWVEHSSRRSNALEPMTFSNRHTAVGWLLDQCLWIGSAYCVCTTVQALQCVPIHSTFQRYLAARMAMIMRLAVSAGFYNLVTFVLFHVLQTLVM